MSGGGGGERAPVSDGWRSWEEELVSAVGVERVVGDCAWAGERIVRLVEGSCEGM